MVRGSLTAFFRIFFSFAKRPLLRPNEKSSGPIEPLLESFTCLGGHEVASPLLRSKVSEQIGTPLISKLAVNSQLYLSPCSSPRHCQNYTPFRFQSSYTRPPYPAAIPHLLHHFIICAHSPMIACAHSRPPTSPHCLRAFSLLAPIRLIRLRLRLTT